MPLFLIDFDVVAGSGSGGILAALLFIVVAINGRSSYSTRFFWQKYWGSAKSRESFRKNFRRKLTLKDYHQDLLCITCLRSFNTCPISYFPVLIALEMDGYDFKMSGLSASQKTSADVFQQWVEGRWDNAFGSTMRTSKIGLLMSFYHRQDLSGLPGRGRKAYDTV
ncbi:hypothetical protein NC652_035441 [Populus alba x Populus x berolinensis]|nr:hypothetical protein NC652_035441 [Populus alba x Populus x berolinensis]